MQIVVATRNEHKLAEIRRMAEGLVEGVEWLGLSDFPAYPEPQETGLSFAENALIKAEVAAKQCGCVAVADDSGLTVELLHDMPGILSSRWSGAQATDESNLQLVLDQIADYPDHLRAAKFVCALAIAAPNGKYQVAQHHVSGMLLRAPVGDNGFGYDPIFCPDGYEITTAQMSAAQKDAISHRGKAIRSLIDFLRRMQEIGALEELPQLLDSDCDTVPKMVSQDEVKM